MDKEKIDQAPKWVSCLPLIGLILIFILAGGVEMVSSSADSDRDAIISVSFSKIDKGFRSGIKERKLVTVKSEKEWGELWRLHKGAFLPEQPVLRIDFKEEMVVGVFSGEKKTGGYGTEITKIEEARDKGELIVFFLETRPPPKAMVTQAITQPYHIVKTRRIDLPAKFVPAG